MRIIFKGGIHQAAQLLKDVEESRGLKADFVAFIELLQQSLPQVSSVSFSGDVVLPAGILPGGADQLSFENYLRPTVEINFPVAGIRVAIKGLPAGSLDQLAAVLATVVGEPAALVLNRSLRRNGETTFASGSFAFYAPTDFKAQPDFRWNSFEARGKGMEIGFEVFAGKGTPMATVRITEMTNRGAGYDFGLALAYLCPHLKILYYSQELAEGWEVIRHGWVVEEGGTRILTEVDYATMEALATSLQPYQELVQGYLRARGMTRRCLYAGHLDAAMEDLYQKGLIHPLLLTNLAIVLANESSLAFAITVLAGFPGVPSIWSLDPETEALRIIDAVLQMKVGWLDLAIAESGEGLTVAYLRQLLLAMYRRRDDAPGLLQLHKQFVQGDYRLEF